MLPFTLDIQAPDLTLTHRAHRNVPHGTGAGGLVSLYTRCTPSHGHD